MFRIGRCYSGFSLDRLHRIELQYTLSLINRFKFNDLIQTDEIGQSIDHLGQASSKLKQIICIHNYKMFKQKINATHNYQYINKYVILYW